MIKSGINQDLIAHSIAQAPFFSYIGHAKLFMASPQKKNDLTNDADCCVFYIHRFTANNREWES